MSTESATLGSTVHLPCHTELDDYVDWIYRRTTIFEGAKYVYSNGNITNFYRPRFHVDTSVKGDYNLTISDAQLSDSGIYRCIEEDGLGHAQNFILLNVSGSFSFVSQLIIRLYHRMFR
jgi:hypothetical protein